MCNIDYNKHEKNCNKIHYDNNINLWEIGKRKGRHTEKSSLRSELIRKRLHLMEKIEEKIEADHKLSALLRAEVLNLVLKTINKALGDSKINDRIVDMIIREVESIEEDSACKKVLVTSNDETIDMIKNGIREDIRKDVVFLKNQELTGGDLHIFSDRKIAFHGGVKSLIKYEHSQFGDEN